MPQRCWAENAMPQWNAGASKASVDRLCDYRRTDINGNHLTPGPEWGQHQAARALIKGKKKTSMVEGGGGLDVILSDHHTGPVSYQPEDLSSPLNFSGLMKRPDTGLTKNERERKKKKTMATQNGVEWDSDPLPFDIWWSHYATIYLKSFEFIQACRERDIVQRRGEEEHTELFIQILKNAKAGILYQCTVHHIRMWHAFSHVN